MQRRILPLILLTLGAAPLSVASAAPTATVPSGHHSHRARHHAPPHKKEHHPVVHPSKPKKPAPDKPKPKAS